ncbi:MAG: hypothetical protein JO344_15190, partial [Planctomycetaceae bacterium]|nr:hypothetical protein [Planctomycetaceae bacterium]
LIHNRTIAELPDRPGELLGLARRLNYHATAPEEAVAALLADVAFHRSCTRTIFERYVGSPGAEE